MEPWIRKYLTKNPSDIIGQENAVTALKNYISNYGKSSKPLLCFGPPGSGKTSSIYAIASEFSYEIVEINASDVRNKAAIDELLTKVLGQQSLFSQGKIILIDEVDGISGTKDRGGVAELLKLLKTSSFPFIFTANDAFSDKLKALRKVCELVEFQPLDPNQVVIKFKTILDSETMPYSEESLKSIARRSGGDLRSAINDLQILSALGNLENVDLSLLGQRDQTEPITQGLMKVFKTTNVDVARHAFDSVQENLDEIIMWIDENLPKEYLQSSDLSKAYERLSRAMVFKGRIMRWQHWHFLVYVSALSTAGVAISKEEKYKGLITYSQSMRPLKIWQANMKYQKRKAIAEKIAEKTHQSTKQVIQESLPYYQYMMRSNKTVQQQFQTYFELGDEEVSWMIQ